VGQTSCLRRLPLTATIAGLFYSIKKFGCMKTTFFVLWLAAVLIACNTTAEKTETPSAEPATSSAPADLPFKASYSTSWTTDVSDADLKLVLQSYKDWADGNITGLAAAMADTVDFDMWNGDRLHISNADLMKMWGKSRDSLSKVEIDMASWQKMYASDKKEGYVVVWYTEIDTYKDGRVDSAAWHDINMVKDGKLTWYAQYRRPLKPAK
jgi:hypothetical protein